MVVSGLALGKYGSGELGHFDKGGSGVEQKKQRVVYTRR